MRREARGRRSLPSCPYFLLRMMPEKKWSTWGIEFGSRAVTWLSTARVGSSPRRLLAGPTLLVSGTRQGLRTHEKRS